MFSNKGDWILDLFSGTGMGLALYTPYLYINWLLHCSDDLIMIVIGTTFACALKLFRNLVALEKDEERVSFVNKRIKVLWDCPDQDKEVGAKHIAEGERFQAASREPILPLAGELGELIELDDELLEDPTVANLTRSGDTKL